MGGAKLGMASQQGTRGTHVCVRGGIYLVKTKARVIEKTINAGIEYIQRLVTKIASVYKLITLLLLAGARMNRVHRGCT